MRRINKIGLLAVGDSAWQGGIQYITNIIHALNRVGKERGLEVHLFKREGQNFTDIENCLNIKLVVHFVKDVFSPFSLPNRVYWFMQRKLMDRINPQLENYFLKNDFDYVFPATLSTCNGQLNSGSWIADFQYHNFPDGHSKQTTLEASRTIGFIACKTKKVILSSASCEKDCLELFPVTKGNTNVMPFTVYINDLHLREDNLLAVREKYGIQGPYVMVSNLFGATKNHKTLFAALGILRKKGIKITCVCTGNFVNYAQMEFTNEILQFITENGIRDQLFILGLIPRDHQIALYRMSMAMVQPSMHEGWSTCVEEAKALGKVLVLSDIDVHKEQYPDNPFFFGTINPSDLADKLEAVNKMQATLNFPQLDREREALRSYNDNIISFANNFLRIASL